MALKSLDAVCTHIHTHAHTHHQTDHFKNQHACLKPRVLHVQFGGEFKVAGTKEAPFI